MRDTYSEGFSLGVSYAEADIAAGLGTQHDELERLREEATTPQPHLRAFYLGALRGYRSVVRTLRDGRWGT